MTDRLQLRKCALKNTLYHLIARASKILEEMQGDGEASEYVLNRMNIGWADYVKAYQEYRWECNPPPPPPPPPPSSVQPQDPNVSDSTTTSTTSETIKCDICSNYLHTQTTVKLMPCGHTFHTVCAEYWLQSRETCPLCHEAVESIQYN